MRSFRRLAVFAVIAAWGAPAAYAGNFFETDGVAIGGYDPVAYFTQHSAVPGLVTVTAAYQGSTFRFASIEDRDQFTANPAKYAPQFRGYCTFAVAEGAKAPSNPAAFRVIDGKLYLQYSEAVTRRFDQSPAKYLQAAETNWPSVQNKQLEK